MYKKDTKELEQWITSAHINDLDGFLRDYDDVSFLSYLNEFMNKKQLSKSEVIIKSQLPRTYAYQIFQGLKQPGRDKILQLAFALALDIEETNRLLKSAGKSPLYAKTKRDALILYALQKKLDLYTLNIYLDEYHFPLLGNYD